MNNFSNCYRLYCSQLDREIILDKEITIIGSKEPSHEIIKHSSISPQHCSFEYVNEHLLLRDVSDKGTYVDNQLINTSTFPLQGNERIRFGEDLSEWEFIDPQMSLKDQKISLIDSKILKEDNQNKINHLLEMENC